MVSQSSNMGKRTPDLSDRTDIQTFSNKDKDSSSSPATVPMITEVSSMGLKVMEGRVSGKVMREGEKKAFPCKYCQRKFSSSQALGGHQKMHKRERSLIKLNDGGRHHGGSLLIHGSSAEHIAHKFPTVASLYKAATSRPLGIQAQLSMVHKPYMYGRQNWTWPAMSTNLMQQQEGIGRLLGDQLYDGKVMPTLRYDGQTYRHQLADNGGAESVINGSIDPEYLTKDEPKLDLTLRL